MGKTLADASSFPTVKSQAPPALLPPSKAIHFYGTVHGSVGTVVMRVRLDDLSGLFQP